MSGEEIRQEILRSVKSLKAAKSLYEADLFEDAISRAYYTVMHAAKAVLLSQNVSVYSHDAVKRLFGSYMVKTGKIEKTYAKMLSEAQDERYLADYDVAFQPEKTRVKKRILDAEKFLNAMVVFLDESGIKTD